MVRNDIQFATLKNASFTSETTLSEKNTRELQIAFQLSGKDANEVMVFIMGLGTSMVSWDKRFLRAFSESKYSPGRFSTLVFDNRDAGKSTSLDELKTLSLSEMFECIQNNRPLVPPYLLSDMAKDLVMLLDELEIERAHIVGASMGGMIAQELAIYFPEKVRSLAVIMSSTGHPSLPVGDTKILQALLSKPEEDLEKQIQAQMELLRLLSGNHVKWKETQLHNYAKRVLAHGTNPLGALRQMAAILGSPHRREGLKKIQVPTVVIHGKEDALIPIECGLDVARQISDSTFLEIQGMGHSLHPSHWPVITKSILQNIQRTKKLS